MKPAISSLLLCFIAAETSKAGDAPSYPLVWDSFDQTVDLYADGSATKTVTQTVRPLTAQGVQAISMVPFPVSKSLQRFELLESWVETPDKRRILIDPRSIVTQAPAFAAQAGTLSDVELKVLPVPQLAVGGTLHVAVRITQHKPYFPGRFFDPVVTLPFLPRQQSIVTYRSPAGMNLKVGQRDWTPLPMTQDGER
jgi:Domain of Unknown Function with PDB structure (DUF3857)